MATYKELHGTDLEVVTSDPSNPVVGQVWYNTTTEQLKTRRKFVTNAWSTGGNLNQARSGMAGAGTQTAALGFGGAAPPGNPTYVLTEQYDGTSWTEVNDMNTARSFMGRSGTQTSALGFAGTIQPGAVQDKKNLGMEQTGQN